METDKTALWDSATHSLRLPQPECVSASMCNFPPLEVLPGGESCFLQGQSLHMGVSLDKAGMEGIDKTKIDRIILDCTKGTPFYFNELRKQQRTQKRIAELLEQKKSLSPENLLKARLHVTQVVKSLEQDVDLSRTIVHIDMDAFYAAVELRDQPQLATCPLAVGTTAMLTTSNYIARRYGVRAAMPGFIAKKLCPDLVIIPPNFEKYRSVSKVIGQLFSLYDPNYVSVSLDEAYLDLTEYIRLNQSMLTGKSCVTLAELVVQEIRARIWEVTKLTASAGIAANTMLAKICSDRNKPNGQYYLEPNKSTITSFLRNLPIRKVCGVGKVTEELLRALGVVVCGDLDEALPELYLLFQPASFQHFLDISLGRGNTCLPTRSESRSVSRETTLSPTSDPRELREVLSELCSVVSEALRLQRLCGRCVTLKLKLDTFEVRTRSRTCASAIDSPGAILGMASLLLTKEMSNMKCRPLRLRLIGVRVSCLETGRSQSSLDDSTNMSMLEKSSSHSPARDSPPVGNRFEQVLCPEEVLVGPEVPAKLCDTVVPALTLTVHEPDGQELNRLPSPSVQAPLSLTWITDTADSDVNVELNPLSSSDSQPCPQELPINAGQPTLRQPQFDVVRDQSAMGPIVVCPICANSLSFPPDGPELNSHIDECLNLVALADIFGGPESLPATCLHSPALLSLPGVGRKVADCVCVMSLCKDSAVPIDTHMHQIALLHYLPQPDGGKSLTDLKYKKIGDRFRQVHGTMAGWAQLFLFACKLGIFQTHANCPDCIMEGFGSKKTVRRKRIRVREADDVDNDDDD